MDAIAGLLEFLKKKDLAAGHFLGLLHVLVGRTISRADGTPVSRGMVWRDLAGWLKKMRWEAEAVRELGVNPDDLPPRDRERYWYTAICRAGLDSPTAAAAGDKFADVLRQNGFDVGPAPKE